MSRRFPVALALGGLVLAGTASAYAQGAESLKAKIPFDFKVGSTTLPAGEYRVVYEPAEYPSMLDVSSVDGRHQAMALTDPVDARKGAPDINRLVFEKTGGTYVLSEVFAKGSSEGVEILGTHLKG